MKILSWNCRGSAWSGFKAQSSFYASSIDPDVFCFLDTRTSTILNETRQFPYDDAFFVPALGQSGGIALFWKTRMVKVDVIVPHNRFIHCEITDLATNDHYFTTFAYAYAQKHKQADLWEEIINLRPTNNEKWLLIGDFNIITSLDEKLGGNQSVTTYMKNFIDMMNRANLFSINAIGVPYTWTNYQDDDNAIFERLDRALSNTALLNDYPDLKLENFPIVGSDHGPICLTLKQRQRKPRKSFKIEAMWLSHKTFKPMVKDLWNQQLDNDSLLNFITITNQFAQQARVWNKNVYGNIFRKIETLNDRSNDIQKQLMLSPFSMFLQEQDNKIREELMQCYASEETFWTQRAKANWLRLGDRNTKFFQTQVNMRKRSNTITKLQSDAGVWITNEQ